MHSSMGRRRLGALLCVLLCGMVSSASAEAHWRKWERHVVPGAYCGDGSPYAIFMSKGQSSKLAIALMGGGACWDTATCWGPTKLAWIHGFPFLIEQLGGFFSPDVGITDAADTTMVHFPYCTGDVHLGRHVAKYDGVFPVFHYGAINVERGLEYLVDELGVDPYAVEDVTLYGYSAGALGAFSHVEKVDAMFPSATRRTLLADAPGLHFGPRFWNKFSKELVNDYRKAMRAAGVELDTTKGQLADIVSTVCKRNPHWEIGVLQGSRDIIMSALFGNTTMETHHRSVFGPGGLWERTREPGDNCSAWIPTTEMHTFMVTHPTAEMKAGGTTAYEFTNALMRHAGGRSYRD